PGSPPSYLPLEPGSACAEQEFVRFARLLRFAVARPGDRSPGLATAQRKLAVLARRQAETNRWPARDSSAAYVRNWAADLRQKTRLLTRAPAAQSFSGAPLH